MKQRSLFGSLLALGLSTSACHLSDDTPFAHPAGFVASSAGAGGAAASESGSAGSPEGSSATGGSSVDEGDLLDQAGNPVYNMLANYEGWLNTAADATTRLAQDQLRADNIITWQLPHGGFYKNDLTVYLAPWNGSDARAGWTGADGVELGTIDNNATTTELLFLADVYGRSGEASYQESAQAAFEFLLGMQYASGGFPQVYPARTGTTYSNYVTFNDDAMVRALLVLLRAVNQEPPLDGDVLTDDQRERAATAITIAVDFIVKSQIEQDGVKTVWCAQHDPITYEPRGARSYELPSKSGKESIGVVEFLMTQPQSARIRTAVQAAITWYQSDEVKVVDTAYISRPSTSTDDTYNPIQSVAGSTMWYRFYDLDQNVGFFSGRLPTDNPPGVGKKYDIMEIEPERRYGYQWGGSYGVPLLAYATLVGY